MFSNFSFFFAGGVRRDALYVERDTNHPQLETARLHQLFRSCIGNDRLRYSLILLLLTRPGENYPEDPSAYCLWPRIPGRSRPRSRGSVLNYPGIKTDVRAGGFGEMRSSIYQEHVPCQDKPCFGGASAPGDIRELCSIADQFHCTVKA